MKLNRHIFTIGLGLAVFVAMVVGVSMIDVPGAPQTASSGGGSVKTAPIGEKAAPVRLASAHSLAAPVINMAAARSATPESIPVPCPIWILGELTGYSKTTIRTADGGTPNPKLVPGGIWIMQKFAAVAAETL